MLTSNHYPFIEIVISIGTWSFIEEAYLDTGFEGGTPNSWIFEI
jgi:hypothetical protein